MARQSLSCLLSSHTHCAIHATELMISVSSLDNSYNGQQPRVDGDKHPMVPIERCLAHGANGRVNFPHGAWILHVRVS